MTGFPVYSEVATFKVIDSMDGPHGGRILRLKSVTRSPPGLGTLRNLEMVAIGPSGRICRVRVLDFVVIGGKVRQKRFNATGRIDVRVTEIDDSGPVTLGWKLRPAMARELSRSR